MSKIKYNVKNLKALYAKTKRFANSTPTHGFLLVDLDMQRKYSRLDLEKLLQSLNPVNGFSRGQTDLGVRVNEDFDLYFIMYSLKY